MIGSANLNIMIKAARRAGRALAKDFREVENLQVSMKSAGDFVSRADINAERLLKEDLLVARPTYGCGREEGGEEPGKDPTRRWIVDPLDGTTNFLHGLPHGRFRSGWNTRARLWPASFMTPARTSYSLPKKARGLVERRAVAGVQPAPADRVGFCNRAAERWQCRLA